MIEGRGQAGGERLGTSGDRQFSGEKFDRSRGFDRERFAKDRDFKGPDLKDREFKDRHAFRDKKFVDRKFAHKRFVHKRFFRPTFGVSVRAGPNWCHRHIFKRKVLHHCHPYDTRWHAHRGFHRSYARF